MNIRFWAIITGIFLLTVLLVGTVQATIYSYVDDAGVVHFTNVPADPKFEPLVQKRQAQAVVHGSNGKEERVAAAGAFDEMIRQASKRYQVDPRLIKSVIRAESNFNHLAISSKGALGLMQLMPATADDMQVLDPLDPKENIYGGTRYLRKMLGLFNGNLRLALAAYNAGPDRVIKLGRVPSFKETENYVRKVQFYYQEYKNLSSPAKRWAKYYYDQPS